jgi:hypothetical protein
VSVPQRGTHRVPIGVESSGLGPLPQDSDRESTEGGGALGGALAQQADRSIAAHEVETFRLTNDRGHPDRARHDEWDQVGRVFDAIAHATDFVIGQEDADVLIGSDHGREARFSGFHCGCGARHVLVRRWCGRGP